MGLENRDYLKDEHYPSCTCVACCRKRSERAAREQHRCDRHDRPMGPSGCPLCLLESQAEGRAGNGTAAPPGDAAAARGQETGGTAAAKPSDSGTPAGDDGKGQRGKKLGDALKGILGKRDST